MSPEQAHGQPLDARTDLFSLGSVLYEMATGRRAFGGDDLALIVMKIINGIIVPPRTVNAAIPEQLEAIIQKLLAVDPTMRYQTAAELAADLEQASHAVRTNAAAGAAGASDAVAGNDSTPGGGPFRSRSPPSSWRGCPGGSVSARAARR